MGHRWSDTPWSEQIIIVMIGLEIVLSLGTIGLTIYESHEQDKVLDNILTAQKKVDTDLIDVGSKLASLDKTMGSTASAVETSANTSVDMNKALQAQLKILATEQKEREAELSRAPKMRLFVNGREIGVSPPTGGATGAIWATRATLELQLRNDGTAPLMNGSLEIRLDNPHVKISCTNCIAKPVSLPFGAEEWNTVTALQIPARLTTGGSVVLNVVAEYAPGTAFDFEVTLEGDNYPPKTFGAIRILSTTPAPGEIPR
jgi:hypothetical protein